MRTVTLKTTDLTDCEIGKFLGAFREVYNQERSITYFKNEYTSTCLEHSFHTLLYNEFDEICGSYSLIPFIYSVKGEEVLVGLGSDLFIKDSYRDNVSNLLSVLNAAIKNAEEVGMVACFGFPNDNSEMVSRAFLKEKRIGLLDTYILPYKIGDYKASMKLLNPFSILFSNCLLGLSLCHHLTILPTQSSGKLGLSLSRPVSNGSTLLIIICIKIMKCSACGKFLHLRESRLAF